MQTIGVIDYGMGNLLSLERALIHIGISVKMIDNYKEINSVDKLILPGVGAFPDGMNNIKKNNLQESINEFAKSGKPFLGICLGMQMMMSKGKEFQDTKGLNLIDGEVLPLPKNMPKNKVPNINWHNIIEPENKQWENSIFKNTENNTNFYFVHSYFVQPKNVENVLAYSMFGELKFCAAIQKDNIFGTQFHPEKSGKEGLKLLETFKNI